MPKTLEADGRLDRPGHDERDKLIQVNVQLTRWDNWRLANYALDNGISKSEAARRAVAEFLDQDEYRRGVRKREWED